MYMYIKCKCFKSAFRGVGGSLVSDPPHDLFSRSGGGFHPLLSRIALNNSL